MYKKVNTKNKINRKIQSKKNYFNFIDLSMDLSDND